MQFKEYLLKSNSRFAQKKKLEKITGVYYVDTECVTRLYLKINKNFDRFDELFVSMDVFREL